MNVVDNALSIFSISLVFSLIGLSVYLTNSVMNIIDITCDGSIALGGCAYGSLMLLGMDPFSAFLFALLFGILAGFATSLLITYIKVNPTLASIITVAGIHTFVLKLSTAGHIYLSNVKETYINSLSPSGNVIIILPIVILISIIFHRIMNSEYGLSIKTFGSGKIMSESLGIDYNRIMFVGLGIANGIAAIAGALIVQIIGTFSASMGAGAFIFGLCSTIISEKLVPSKNTKFAVFRCFLTAFLYKALLEIFTYNSINCLKSEYNNIISVILLIFVIAYINERKKKKRLENF